MLRLEGDRIVLREWRLDEADAMHRWLGNAEVTRFLRWGSKTRSESAIQLENSVHAQSEIPRQRYFLAIELQTTELVVGDAGFEWKEAASKETEGRLGYFLEPEHWGRGYATEAAALLLDFAFDSGATLMRASCHENNTASERVMLRCGMQRDRENEDLGRHAYRISRDQWRTR